MACIEGMHMKHGKPTATAAATATGNPRGPGPVASVAERPIRALKPGNAGRANPNNTPTAKTTVPFRRCKKCIVCWARGITRWSMRT